MNVMRPRATRDGGLDGLSQIARGAERAPRHDELSNPASPSFFAVLAKDPLNLSDVVFVDDLRRRETRARVHSHIERPLGAKAEAALGVVDLGAAETEVEKDQIRRHETVLRSNRAKLRKPCVNNHYGAAKGSQRRPAGFDCNRIAVDPKQLATGRDPLQYLAGMTRLPEGAVDRDRAHSGLKQLYYLL